jgi:hypothetical protein
MASTSSPGFYSDAASFGIVMSDIRAIIGVIVGIALICFGIYTRSHFLPAQPPKHQSQTVPLDIVTARQNQMMGNIIIVLGVLTIIGSLLLTWLAHKYKFIAAMQGVGTGLQMFK